LGIITPALDEINTHNSTNMETIQIQPTSVNNNSNQEQAAKGCILLLNTTYRKPSQTSEDQALLNQIWNIVATANQESPSVYSIGCAGKHNTVVNIIKEALATKDWSRMLFELDNHDIFSCEESPSWRAFITAFQVLGHTVEKGELIWKADPNKRSSLD
jgi:hypothetical protein